MSAPRITSAAIALARKAARDAVSAGHTEVTLSLDDLMVHLAMLKDECAALVEENRVLKEQWSAPPPAGDADGDADPAWVVPV